MSCLNQEVDGWTLVSHSLPNLWNKIPKVTENSEISIRLLDGSSVECTPKNFYSKTKRLNKSRVAGVWIKNPVDAAVPLGALSTA